MLVNTIVTVLWMGPLIWTFYKKHEKTNWSTSVLLLGFFCLHFNKVYLLFFKSENCFHVKYLSSFFSYNIASIWQLETTGLKRAMHLVSRKVKPKWRKVFLSVLKSINWCLRMSSKGSKHGKHSSRLLRIFYYPDFEDNMLKCTRTSLKVHLLHSHPDKIHVMLSVKILPLFFNSFAFHNYMGICPARDPPPVPSKCFPKPQSQYILMPCAITLGYGPS